MADLEKLRANLEARGFRTAYFPTADEAAAYLDGQIDGKTVGIGGSMTVKEMGLYPRLAAHNQVVWHWEGGALRDAVLTDVHHLRQRAGGDWGDRQHRWQRQPGLPPPCTATRRSTSWWVSTRSPPDFEAALWRARNVAAPKRAQSMGCRTPCAAKADRCYDCKSPERICRGLAVLWARPNATEEMEVVLIGEALGM